MTRLQDFYKKIADAKNANIDQQITKEKPKNKNIVANKILVNSLRSTKENDVITSQDINNYNQKLKK